MKLNIIGKPLYLRDDKCVFNKYEDQPSEWWSSYIGSIVFYCVSKFFAFAQDICPPVSHTLY